MTIRRLNSEALICGTSQRHILNSIVWHGNDTKVGNSVGLAGGLAIVSKKAGSDPCFGTRAAPGEGLSRIWLVGCFLLGAL